MNQKERDKFPRIYKLMKELYKYDCDKQLWESIYKELNDLEPDYNYLAEMTDNYLQDLVKQMSFANLNPAVQQIFNDAWINPWYTPNELLLVNNYTQKWSITLKRAFIVVIGAFYEYYKQGIQQEIINTMFKAWLEYKKENGNWEI